ncbi:MAG: TrmH family RNA methyltransferase [Patescibacteria group bacterium]
MKISILLHDIRSTHNVGAVLRTADAVGVSKVYFSGFTPAPIDRFGRARKDIAKASLGAEKTVPWEVVLDPKELIKKLKGEKVRIVALEQNKKSIDYTQITKTKDMLVVLGREVEGVEEGILKLCDEIVEIPMRGTKESLNVSVATGILLYKIIE